MSGLLQVRRLDASLREDFLRLHAADTDLGWCRCVAWWVTTWDGWGERTAEENLALRERLFGRGEYDGYLGYLEETPVAWCQVGPRDRLEKLTRELELAPGPACWAITCFVVAPGLRRRGLATGLLEAVLSDLGERGVSRVEAYPRTGEGLDAGELWTGAAATHARAGFEHVKDAGRRAVFALDLGQ